MRVIRALIIGLESDHMLCLSLTDSLTHSCLVKLIDVTLAFEDVYSKLVEVVTVAHVDDDNSLVQTLSTRFQGLVKILKFNLGRDCEARFGQDF